MRLKRTIRICLLLMALSFLLQAEGRAMMALSTGARICKVPTRSCQLQESAQQDKVTCINPGGASTVWTCPAGQASCLAGKHRSAPRPAIPCDLCGPCNSPGQDWGKGW